MWELNWILMQNYIVSDLLWLFSVRLIHCEAYEQDNIHICVVLGFIIQVCYIFAFVFGLSS